MYTYKNVRNNNNHNYNVSITTVLLYICHIVDYATHLSFVSTYPSHVDV